MTRTLSERTFWLLLIVASLWSHIQPLQALTIYRIGGESLPPPEIDAPFEFVQLPWDAIDAELHGSSDHVAITPDSIGPLRLDPSRNLTPILTEFGGRVAVKTWAGWSNPTAEDRQAFDGDSTTVFVGDATIKTTNGDPDEKHFLFSFGTPIFVSKIRFFPRPQFRQERFLEHFVVGTRDENPLKAGSREYVTDACGVTCESFDFDLIHDVDENRRAEIELSLSGEPISQLLFQGFQNSRGFWELAELQIFGAGYVPASSYISNVIDLGAPSSLGDLSWSGVQGDDSRFDLSSRFGIDDDPNTYWRNTFNGDEVSRFDRNGTELTLSSYNRLPALERARITPDSEHWEFWSAPFEFDSGSAILGAPGAQQFVQFRAAIEAGLESGGRLDFLQFSATTPSVVSEVVAEIVPASAAAGEATSFTYKVRPFFATSDRGFDAIEVFTPTTPVSIDAVRISGVDVGIDTLRVDANGFAVRLPPVDIQRTGELIEVDFRAEIFKFSTRFAGRVFDSTTPHEVHQAVRQGDADQLADGNGLEVRLEQFVDTSILSLELSTPALTPNGDGTNDLLLFEVSLLNLTAAVPVQIELFDLSGRLLGRVHEGVSSNGRFTASWNGEIDGQLVAPGLYVASLRVEADRKTERSERVVALVY
jgi:hypothetical protein